MRKKRRKNSKWNKNLKRVHGDTMTDLKKADKLQQKKSLFKKLIEKLNPIIPNPKVNPWRNKKEMKEYKRRRKNHLQKRCENA
jgi:hypothetical protein